MRWTPESLAALARGTLRKRGGRPIEGVFIDSRLPRASGLFVPIVAARDGHDFVPAAIAAGASAVLIGAGHRVPDGDVTVVEVDDTLAALGRLASARRSAFEGPVVAVTGSNGKTTTRSMIAAALGSVHEAMLTTAGNFNNHLGVPLTLLGEPEHPTAMVLELGMSAPGENRRLAELVRPTVHVVTSVALEHLEFMKTIEAIAAAECEPIEQVPRDGFVVVPSDEPLLHPHLPMPDGPRVLKFGPDAHAEVRIAAVEQGERTVAHLEIEGRPRLVVHLQAFGLHNARNAAAAVAVALALELPLGGVVEALEAVVPVGDRGRVLEYGAHLVVADCYNANPGSVAAALQSLAAVRAERMGPLVAVLGDMLELGPTEIELHEHIGDLANSLGIDAVIGFGPRAEAMVAAARRGGTWAEHVGEDVDAAVDLVRKRLTRAEPGAVLIKGSRGMRLERVVQALVEPR